MAGARYSSLSRDVHFFYGPLKWMRKQFSPILKLSLYFSMSIGRIVLIVDGPLLLSCISYKRSTDSDFQTAIDSFQV